MNENGLSHAHRCFPVFLNSSYISGAIYQHISVLCSMLNKEFVFVYQ